jgi:L-ascorbate metabolism protein UlaG (beta-lactamase superfamily)
VLRWWRTRTAVAWPERLPLAPHAPPPNRAPAGSIALTSIGHATFLVQTGRVGVLTDPVFTSHAGPFGRLGPRRVRPPGLAIEALPRIDLVLLSHNHYDHLQPASLGAVARRDDPLFIVPLGLGAYLARHGIRRTVEMDWWGEAEPLPGVRVTCVPAQHFSARTLRDRNLTLWAGFVLEADNASIYFAGDSGYSPHFGEIGRRIGSLDLALVPIGAYEPRWFMQPAHVNPAEAVQIHRDVGAHVSVGMHYGTFHLADEPFDEPLALLAEARAAAGLRDEEFTTLEAGETRVFAGGGRRGLTN